MKNNKYVIPALRGRFGDWAYYSCLMTLGEIASRIDFAHNIHKNKKLSQMIQRKLKDERSGQIAEYLIRDKQRFFNSLVVAVYDGEPVWHEFHDIEMEDHRSSLKDEDIPYIARYSIGFLTMTGEENLFALDGQHRLSGIKAAIKQKPDLEEEEAPIIMVAHRTNEEGMKRTRHLFSTLNKTAKPVSKGDIIALDESDVMAVVTRKLVEENRKFGGDCVAFVERANLPAGNANNLTTIVNIYDVLSSVFMGVSPRKDVKDSMTSGVHSTPEEISGYYEKAVEFFSILQRVFPEFSRYMNSNERRRGEMLLANRKNQAESEVLFRPVGILLVADIFSVLQEKYSQDIIFKKMRALPKTFGEAPYVDLLWDPVSGKLSTGRRAIVRSLLLYMLGEEIGEAGLRRRLARIRGVSPSAIKLPHKLWG